MRGKIRIMNKKPEISDGEIQSYMNFDKVLKQTTDAVGQQKRRSIKQVGFGALLSLAVLSVWLFYKQSDQPMSAIPAKVQTKEDTQTTSDRIERDTIASQNQKLKDLKADTPNSALPSPTSKTGASSDANEDKTSMIKSDTIADSKKDRQTNFAVYAQAEPAKGYPALYSYFQESLAYPVEAVADSVEGVVTVVFSINTEGRAEKIYIEQSLGELFDKEAIRVIEHMPLWKPASYNGIPVSSKMSLPLTFQIKKIKTQ